ncbi:zinc finger protein 572 [Tachysurus vachellii]|uniref:zinc finger protein 572 n=1 Tax=Tachysurus vachellii TaxID=175792 RepID=UPI00296A9D66|nr:zinc finger protein 572 [Tachysurus vachellii]
MSSVDIHSQLASIIERFAKGALVEMTKVIDKDSALLRAEIARRQMEVEALLCKLQYAENELRSARQAAATRQSAANRRSVAVQVTITAALQEPNDTHTDTRMDASSNAKENSAEAFQVKEERTELKPWDSADEIEETRVCWEEERHASNTSEEGLHDAKPSVIWDSPELEDFNMRTETSQDTTNADHAHHSTNASPNPREENTVHYQYQQTTDSDAGQHRLSRLTNINANAAAHNLASEHRGDGVGTGEKSSRCAQCGKTFTTRFYLKIHQRIHTGERPYTCLQCGKRFYCNSHLISHQRCHTGEKPYSCEECGKSYSHLNSLKLHQRSHTEEEVCNFW